MRDTDYAFCVARLRACESEMLTKDDLERLVQTHDFNKAVAFLKERNWIQGGKTVKDFLDFQGEKLWNLLCESVPDKNELDIFCVLNDFFNIKVAVKCLLSHKEPDEYYIKPTTLNLENLTKELRNEERSLLFCKKFKAAEEAYNIAVRTENGQYADIILDKAALEHLMIYSKEKSNNIASEISAFICDSTNMKIALRCASLNKDKTFIGEAISDCKLLSRKALVEKAAENSEELYSYLATTKYSEGAEVYRNNCSAFDKWCQKKILEIAHNAVYTAFGFAPVCDYYYKKNYEIKTVGFILNSLQSGVQQKRIMERIADSYV